MNSFIINTATANSKSLISHTMLLLFIECLCSLATQPLVLSIGWFGMGDKLQTGCRVLKPETNQKVNEEKNDSFFFHECSLITSTPEQSSLREEEKGKSGMEMNSVLSHVSYEGQESSWIRFM